MNRQELNDLFNTISPTQAQKERMLQSILEEEQPVKTTIKAVTMTVVVAVVCLLTSIAALAGTFGWHEKLVEFLNPTKTQMEELEGAVNNPQAQVVKDGITVSVLQTITDSHGIYVLYDMAVPEWITLNDDVIWFMESIDAAFTENEGIGVMSLEPPAILSESKNHRTVLLHLDSTMKIQNGTASLFLRDLGYYAAKEDGTSEFVSLVSTEIKLEWPMGFQDTSKTVYPNQPVSVYDAKGVVTEISISPMSVCVMVQGDDMLMAVRPVITFRDGSEISYDVNSENKSFSYSAMNHECSSYMNNLYYRFENLINVADIVSVTVGDVTIPIE